MVAIWQHHNRSARLASLAAAAGFSACVAAVVASIAALGYNRMLTIHSRWQAVPGVMWHTLGYRWMALPFALAFAVTLVAAFVAVVIAMRPRESLYGDARFATNSEIRRAGLLAPRGAIIGMAAGGVVRVHPEKHIYFAAPTRSGKGVGFVIPNLLDHPGSALVLDIKREAYQATSGYRARVVGQSVYLFDPLSIDGKTCCFNPLGYIDRSDAIAVVTELQRMALQWLPYPTAGNAFFTDAARNGFVGVGAYLAARPAYDLTIANIFALLTNEPQRRLNAALKEIADNPTINITAGAVQLLSSFVKIPPETFGSVKATIESKLGLFGNPRIVMATSRSDFDLRDLRTTPMTVYLGADPDDLTLLSPLYNVIFQQFSSLSTRELPPRPLGWLQRRLRASTIKREARSKGGTAVKAAALHAAVVVATGFEPGQRNAIRVLMILDEFKRVGKMDVIAEGFSYLSGYGIQIVALFQSPAQVAGLYGPHMAREIEANCGAHVFYTPNEPDDAEMLSKRLGIKTVKTRTRSDTRSSVFGSSNGGMGSFNHSETGRALMLPGEVKSMPKTMGLVFLPGELEPFLIKRIRHFEMEPWKQRSACGWLRPPVQDIGRYDRYMQLQGSHEITSPDDIASTPINRIVGDPELRAQVIAITRAMTAAAGAGVDSLSDDTRRWGANFVTALDGSGGKFGNWIERGESAPEDPPRTSAATNTAAERGDSSERSDADAGNGGSIANIVEPELRPERSANVRHGGNTADAGSSVSIAGVAEIENPVRSEREELLKRIQAHRLVA